MRWANFEQFFAGAKIDEMLCAETAGSSCVNDLAIDDYIVTSKLERQLIESDGRLFIVLYTNALHQPFQSESQYAIPDDIKSRSSRATYLIEKQHTVLFDALKLSGRFDDALIVILGDHGEFMREGKHRLTNIREEIYKPLFLVKPPINLPLDMARSLHSNRDKLVAHIDIAPTVAQMLGVRLKPGLDYRGSSLMGPITDDRILYLLNTNEWRAWPRGAVGIFRKDHGVIVDYSGDELCRSFGAGAFDSACTRDALLSAAFRESFVRKSISRIFRDKLSGGAFTGDLLDHPALGRN